MVTSFGYDRGAAPVNVRKVFDVRNLTHDVKNPEFDSKEQEILDYCRQYPSHDIAIGCKLGKHRSKELAARVARKTATAVWHRDR
jgi:RNase adaptor protein for sRNA GlmZ degradation